MPWCVVFGCKNNMKATKRAGKNVSYHIFPKNPQRRSAWINTLNRPFKFNADSSYVCSEHFVLDDFECYSLKEELLNIKVKRQLKKTAIPSINIYKSSEKEQFDVSDSLLNSQKSNEYLNKSTIKIDVEQHCAVPTCNNIISKSDKPNNCSKIIFHKFPSNIEVFEKWLEFCNCSKEFLSDYQNALICSEHFNDDSYELKYTTESIHPVKKLKKDAVPQCNGVNKMLEVKNVNDDSVRKRKMLVDKLLADYEEQQKNEGHLNGMVAKYPSFFSPKINPNAKLADKLKLLKAIDNPESCSPPKKSKIVPLSKSNSVKLELSSSNSSQGNDQVIQVSAVKGGLMLHALPQIATNVSNSCHEKTDTDEEEEIIIVTEDEASCVNLSSYEEQHKENNTEIIIVTNSKETEDTLSYVESVPKKSSTKVNDYQNKYCVQNRLENNENPSTSSYTAKVTLMEDKGCQVLVPCKGCEHRSLKINKLLRERTRLLKDLNQNSTWKDPDEITTLRKMNGVLSLLLKQCVGEKYSKKSSSIRVDIVQDCIERINRGWSMNDTSETLCQALSGNAYDEFARTFEIINET